MQGDGEARMSSALAATTVAAFELEFCIYRLSELLRELLNEISWCHKSARGVIPQRTMCEGGPDGFVGRVVS